MRLIDADTLPKSFDNRKAPEILQKCPLKYYLPMYDDIKECIEEQPTAYDVENVVKQLKVAKKTALHKVRMIFLIVTKRDLQEFVNMCFDEAIRIVRNGGIK